MDIFSNNLFNIDSVSVLDFIGDFFRSDGFTEVFLIIKMVLATFSVIFLFLVVLVIFKINKLQSGEVSEKPQVPQIERGRFAGKWERVIEKSRSKIPSDWKLAVIEADKLLDSALKLMGYTGDTMGDRLKQLDVLHFPDLNNFWAAHKIRNRIVHNPDYDIIQDEFNFALKTYEGALRDLNAI